MRIIILVLMMVISFAGKAQHCPWDCSGILLLQTDISNVDMKKMNPVLVDGNKKIIVDTIYGTGKATYDSCRFLIYDEFIAYRISRIPLHNWYSYDTMMHFARDKYVIHYGYCRNSHKKLFLRLTNPDNQRHQYIEIPDNKRIHLHDYNIEILEKLDQKIIDAVQPNILFLRKEDLDF